MENRQQVPKFGDWTQDTPFSIVFEKVNKSKKNTDTSNNNEYPEMNPKPAQNRNRRHDQTPNHNVRPRHERFSSREETEFRPFTPSPAHNERNMRVRAPPTLKTYNHQPYGGGGRSVENLSDTNSRKPHNPPPVQPRGRSSERTATIPPFPGSSGSENDQSYTLIFDKVKEDMNQSGSGRSYNGTDHSTSTRPINDKHHQPLPSSSPKGCCFPPWSRKGSY